MIDLLKSLYGQAFVSDLSEDMDADGCYWFKTKNGVPFGLRKSAVTEKEYQLLTLSYDTVELPPKWLSHEEQLWSAGLFEGSAHPLPVSNEKSHYILHIYFKLPLKEIDAFREAILAFFDEVPVILWRNQNSVLIILKERPDQGKASEIAQLLVTDFYSDASLFIGQVLNDPLSAKGQFELEEKVFESARKAFPEKRSYTFEGILPFFLLSITSKEVLGASFSSLRQAIKEEDPEWVTSLMAFFEHGLNITAASKALFIHRNSLQYRLERFIEKTGLDPKQFDEALFIYLALLTQKLD